MRGYVSRTLERALRHAGKQFPVVVLTGPRQTGKSTLCRHVFPGHSYQTLDDPALRDLARRDPRLFLENVGTRVVIDEIQYVPEILPYVKMAVDQDQGRSYVLIGSQVFTLMAGLSETLAGRAAIFELLGFSWAELPGNVPATEIGCFRQILRGFYPAPALNRVDPATFYGSYLNTYIERDIRQIRSIQDLSLFQTFVQLLAARAGAVLNLNEVSRVCGVNHVTARRWLSLLETTRIVYLLRPYFGNVTKRLIKSPKLYFTDSGFLAYLLNYRSADTLAAGPSAGAIFENMVIMELLKAKFNGESGFELFFYRDSNGNEVDVILDRGSEKTLVEIKKSRTLRQEWSTTMERVLDLFPGASGVVLSLAPERLKLSARTVCVPWWGHTAIMGARWLKGSGSLKTGR